MTILELPPVKWDLTKAKKIESNGMDLGDGYTLTGTIPYSGRDTFNITIPGLTTQDFNELWAIIKDFAGFKSFEWREFSWQDYKTYVFDGEPQVIPQGQNCWELRLVLKEVTPITVITDPYADNVVLYLKGDGTSGSTAVIDSSPLQNTMSAFGNAQISTAQSKYGRSSLYFDGNGDYITTEALGLFNIDFTVEYWIYVLEAKSGTILSSYNLPNQENVFLNFTHSDGTIIAFSGGSESPIVATPAITNNTWVHVATTYDHSQEKLEIYLNGNLAQSSSVVRITDENSTLWIGGAPNDNNIGTWWLHAYVDSLRVTRGIVRYTANFNPETDTYLNI